MSGGAHGSRDWGESRPHQAVQAEAGEAPGRENGLHPGDGGSTGFDSDSCVRDLVILKDHLGFSTKRNWQGCVLEAEKDIRLVRYAGRALTSEPRWGVHVDKMGRAPKRVMSAWVARLCAAVEGPEAVQSHRGPQHVCGKELRRGRRQSSRRAQALPSLQEQERPGH